jgi:hypothetical protein
VSNKVITLVTERWSLSEPLHRRLDGDGGVWLRVCVHSSLTLRLGLRLGTLSFCPPTFAFALALALVPAFARTLAPTLSLVPVMPASTWYGMGRASLELWWYAHAPAHSQRWKSAGAGTGAARAHPPLPIALPPRTHLSSLDAYANARVVELGRGADSGVYEGVWSAPCTRPRARAGCPCIRAGVPIFFLHGYGGRTLHGSGYTFAFGCALA